MPGYGAVPAPGQPAGCLLIAEADDGPYGRQRRAPRARTERRPGFRPPRPGGPARCWGPPPRSPGRAPPRAPPAQSARVDGRVTGHRRCQRSPRPPSRYHHRPAGGGQGGHDLRSSLVAAGAPGPQRPGGTRGTVVRQPRGAVPESVPAAADSRAPSGRRVGKPAAGTSDRSRCASGGRPRRVAQVQQTARVVLADRADPGHPASRRAAREGAATGGRR